MPDPPEGVEDVPEHIAIDLIAHTHERVATAA
jgi:hypothetical protein